MTEVSTIQPTKLIVHARRNQMILTPIRHHISPSLPQYPTHVPDLTVGGGGGVIRQIAPPGRLLTPKARYQNLKNHHILLISNPPLRY